MMWGGNSIVLDVNLIDVDFKVIILRYINTKTVKLKYDIFVPDKIINLWPEEGREGPVLVGLDFLWPPVLFPWCHQSGVLLTSL